MDTQTSVLLSDPVVIALVGGIILILLALGASPRRQVIVVETLADPVDQGGTGCGTLLLAAIAILILIAVLGNSPTLAGL